MLNIKPVRTSKKKYVEYSKLRHPDFYKEERIYLKTNVMKYNVCRTKRQAILLLNMPPRHGKSFTVKIVLVVFDIIPKLK